MSSPAPLADLDGADPYELLGVAPKATEEEIAAGHRARIRLAHPDCGGSDEPASLLNVARDILLNPSWRAEYDRSVALTQIPDVVYPEHMYVRVPEPTYEPTYAPRPEPAPAPKPAPQHHQPQPPPEPKQPQPPPEPKQSQTPRAPDPPPTSAPKQPRPQPPPESGQPRPQPPPKSRQHRPAPGPEPAPERQVEAEPVYASAQATWNAGRAGSRTVDGSDQWEARVTGASSVNRTTTAPRWLFRVRDVLAILLILALVYYGALAFGQSMRLTGKRPAGMPRSTPAICSPVAAVTDGASSGPSSASGCPRLHGR